MLVFDKVVPEETLRQHLTVTGPCGTIELTWPEWAPNTDSDSAGDNYIANLDKCNVLTDVVERSDNSGESDRLVIVYLGENAQSGEYTVTTENIAAEQMLPEELPEPRTLEEADLQEMVRRLRQMGEDRREPLAGPVAG